MSEKQAPQRVESQPNHPAEWSPDRFLNRLAERLGSQANTTTVYGQPVEREGVTVIPVAKVQWGLGGGHSNSEAHVDGSGGGGGMDILPLGYIEIAGGKSEFRRIYDPAMLAEVRRQRDDLLAQNEALRREVAQGDVERAELRRLLAKAQNHASAPANHRQRPAKEQPSQP